MTPKLALIGAAAVLVALSGCGSRPSEDGLAQSILTAANSDTSTVSVSPEQARCIARALLAAGLSDATLSGLAADFDRPQVLQSEADKVEPVVSAAAQQCSNDDPDGSPPSTRGTGG